MIRSVLAVGLLLVAGNLVPSETVPGEFTEIETTRSSKGGIPVAWQSPDWEVVAEGNLKNVLEYGHDLGYRRIRDAVKTRHLFAVGVMAGRAGAVTIWDGEPIVSQVQADGSLISRGQEAKEEKAALLIGAPVGKWMTIEVQEDISHQKLNKFLLDTAKSHGIDVFSPFPFLIDGELQTVKLHVINGACPLMAQRHNQQLPDDKRPYVKEFEAVEGKIVGVCAMNSTKGFTHSGYRTNAHLIFEDEAQQKATGFLETFGIKKGSKLMLPAGRSGR